MWRRRGARKESSISARLAQVEVWPRLGVQYDTGLRVAWWRAERVVPTSTCAIGTMGTKSSKQGGQKVVGGPKPKQLASGDEQAGPDPAH